MTAPGRRPPGWSRREFLAAGAAPFLAGCFGSGDLITGPRLSVRPGSATMTLAAGTIRPDIGNTSMVVYTPASAITRSPVPVMVFLHGALRTVETFVDGHKPLADQHGVVVAAPYAVSGTWDAMQTGFGRDVAALDRCLEWLFQRVPVATARLTLAGFSDGATYTLGLGRANGDLFSRLVAYSPGGLLGGVTAAGKPPILISHGREDPILPYTISADVVVPSLEGAGYEVDFRSFTGGHAVYLPALQSAMAVLGAA